MIETAVGILQWMKFSNVLDLIKSNLIEKYRKRNPPSAAVAEMCGTSITQIEKTYYHTTTEKIVSNALADYTYVESMLVPK